MSEGEGEQKDREVVSGQDTPRPAVRKYTFKLLEWESAPSWVQYNKYIVTGYRADFSWRLCLKSMFRLHNETLNVWTHFIGAVMFLFFFIHMWGFLSPNGHDRLTDFSVDKFSELKNYMNHHARGIGEFVAQASDEAYHLTSERLNSAYHYLQKFEEPLLQKVFGIEGNITKDGLLHMIEERITGISLMMANQYLAFKDDVLRYIAEHRNAPFSNLKDSAAKTLKVTYSELIEFLQSLEEPGLKALLMSELDVLYPVSYLTRFPLAIFLISAFLCLMLSATYHLFYVRSPYVSMVLQRLDYAGISFLISGTSSALSFYGIIDLVIRANLSLAFYCEPHFWLPYYFCSFLLPLGPVIMTFFPVLFEERFSYHRAAMFVAIGISVATPVFHFSIAHGTIPVFAQYAALGGAFYIIGATFYGSKFPECKFPGKCDIWCQSHSIFHIWVVLGALTHYRALHILYEWRILNRCSL